MKALTTQLAICAAMAVGAAPALAQSQGDWTLGVGLANVNPKSDNGTFNLGGGSTAGGNQNGNTNQGNGNQNGNTNQGAGGSTAATIASADVDDATSLTLSGEYFIRDNIGVELLLATPFSHDISVGGTVAGSTKQLPPTISINYHFPIAGPIKPFVGIGLNYTMFFDESSPLGDLKLDDSFGLAVSAGADWQVSPTGAVRLSVRYINIDTDVTLNGTPLGTAEIDPVILGLGYVHRF